MTVVSLVDDGEENYDEEEAGVSETRQINVCGHTSVPLIVK